MNDRLSLCSRGCVSGNTDTSVRQRVLCGCSSVAHGIFQQMGGSRGRCCRTAPPRLDNLPTQARGPIAFPGARAYLLIQNASLTCQLAHGSISISKQHTPSTTHSLLIVGADTAIPPKEHALHFCSVAARRDCSHRKQSGERVRRAHLSCLLAPQASVRETYSR